MSGKGSGGVVHVTAGSLTAGAVAVSGVSCWRMGSKD